MEAIKAYGIEYEIPEGESLEFQAIEPPHTYSPRDDVDFIFMQLRKSPPNIRIMLALRSLENVIETLKDPPTVITEPENRGKGILEYLESLEVRYIQSDHMKNFQAYANELTDIIKTALPEAQPNLIAQVKSNEKLNLDLSFLNRSLRD